MFLRKRLLNIGKWVKHKILEGCEVVMGYWGTAWRSIFEDSGRKFEYVKRMVSCKRCERQGNAVLFDCETNEKSKVKIRLDLCKEDIFRFRMAVSDEIPDNKTAMVIREDWEKVKVEFKDQSDFVSIKTAELSIRINKDPWELSVQDRKGRILCQESPHKVSGAYSRWGFSWYPLGFCKEKSSGEIKVFESMRLFPDEHFYGFGEKFSDLDKRGQKINSWTVDPFGNSSPLSHKNVPFFMSTRGYGIFINSSYEILYQMGSHSHVAYSFQIDSDLMDYYFIYGPSFKKILKRYTELTGRAPVPPKWSFGLWMSKCSYKNRKEVESVCRELRERDIPCDVIHIDPYWMKKGHFTDLEWNEKAFPNPEEMIANLGKKGFKVSLWEHPYVPKGTKMYREGKRGGYFAKRKDGSVYYMFRKPWIGGAVVDFSNPRAVKWYKNKHRKLLRMGVAVFKTDFGEDAPRDAIYHNGMTGREMHNLYPLLYNRAVFEVTKEIRGKGLVWGRSGYAGSQRYPTNWSGDPDPNLLTMVSVLRGGLSYGLSGVPFWSHDIGGFVGKPTPEVYVRWAQFGLFSPHSRCHGQTPREPWKFGKKALRIFRFYVKLRYRLLPYIYSCAHISSQTGLPMIRAMVLEYQDDPNCYDKDLQYLFGDSFLVAPIFDETGTRNIYLPKGKWIDYWTKEEFEGPTNLTYHADLDRLPLFVKADSIIPMGPEMSFVGEKPFNPLTLDIYCYKTAEFNLYDDEETITFKCTKNPRRIVFKITPSTPSPKNYLLKFNKTKCPAKVTKDSKELTRMDKEKIEKAEEGWWFDVSGTVMVKVTAAKGFASITLKMR